VFGKYTEYETTTKITAAVRVKPLKGLRLSFYFTRNILKDFNLG